MLFRREVVEGMRRLQEGEQWTALVDYTIIAWGYVQVYNQEYLLCTV